MKAVTNVESLFRILLGFGLMFAVVTLMTLINQVSGTPYVSGGDSPAGTDCSGLASWVSNVATGRPAFGDRFHTATEERALLARGFQYGTQPGALVIGWNSYHTAVTLPDGTNVSSGERGGVKVGGLGAYQPQFTHHMYLPMPAENAEALEGTVDMAAPPPAFTDPALPPPPLAPEPALPPPPPAFNDPALPPPPLPPELDPNVVVVDMPVENPGAPADVENAPVTPV